MFCKFFFERPLPSFEFRYASNTNLKEDTVG
jgi:hypothetical protein